MLDSDIKSILGEKYNESFFEQGSSLSNVLHKEGILVFDSFISCLLYTSPSPRDAHESRMPSSA